MTKAITASQKSSQNSPTSFPGSLFSASLSRWSRDPGCDWSRDHLSIQNRRVGGYSSAFGREDDKRPHPSTRFFYDQSKPASLFQQLGKAEKRDPGNKVENSQQTQVHDLQLKRFKTRRHNRKQQQQRGGEK